MTNDAKSTIQAAIEQAYGHVNLPRIHRVVVADGLASFYAENDRFIGSMNADDYERLKSEWAKGAG